MTTTTLAFDRTGTGEPLLLLHGLGSTRDDFSALVPRLAPFFDVISLDLPGHGASPATEGEPTVQAMTDAVESTLDSLGLGAVHVLGNSLGGRLALELAVRRRTRSVVAIAPSGIGGPMERLHFSAMMATARVLTRSVRSWIPSLSTSPAGRAALLAGFRARPWDASPTEALAVRGGFADADKFWAAVLWTILLDVPTGLGEVDCPVVLVHGSLDLIGGAQAPRYVPLIRGARARLLLGAGHAPQSDRPDTIVALVRETAARADETEDMAAVAH